jgi:hypothetical protein
MMDTPPQPNREEGEPELMTIPELATRWNLTRQQMHRIATTADGFPPPAPHKGTRAKYEVPAVDAYMASRELRPGRRTDIERKKQAGKQADGKE